MDDGTHSIVNSPGVNTRATHLAGVLRHLENAEQNSSRWFLSKFLLEIFEEVIEVLLGFLFAVSVVRLELTYQLVFLAADLSQIVVGELAPLGFDFARKLFPVTFDFIPIHIASPY